MVEIHDVLVVKMLVHVDHAVVLFVFTEPWLNQQLRI